MTPPRRIEVEGGDPRPVVALPRPGLPGAAIVALAAILAFGLFLILNAAQTRQAQAPLAVQAAPIAAPPPLAVPVETLPAPVPLAPVPLAPLVERPAPQVYPAPRVPILPQPTPPATFPQPVFSSPLQPPIEASSQATKRTSDDALIIDAGQARQGEAAPRPPRGTAPTQPIPGGQGNDAEARATRAGNLATTMITGTIIPVVLETPIDTARPGLVRALVTQDRRGFDGSRVLVTRGSRLIGEYQSEVRGNQNRVLVTWTRLIRPDGVSIRLASPAADSLGGAGIPGRLHTYFLQRFANALLQSALTIGVNLASRPTNGGVLVTLPNATSGLSTAIAPTTDLPPKITVKQGALINVFVARDLDFSGVASSR